MGKGFDDKVAVFVVGEVLCRLKDKLHCAIYGGVQCKKNWGCEELGEPAPLA